MVNKWCPIMGWFEILSSDRGSAFTSEIVARFCNLLNINHNLAEPRNHCSIGKVEIMVKVVKQIK